LTFSIRPGIHLAYT